MLRFAKLTSTLVAVLGITSTIGAVLHGTSPWISALTVVFAVITLVLLNLGGNNETYHRS